MDWGQVFRGFVPTAINLDEQKRRDQQWNDQMGLQREQMGLQRDQFGLQQEAHKSTMDRVARQLAADEGYADLQTFGQEVANNRQAIRGLSNELRDKVKSGELSPEQYSAAMAQYNPANISKQGSAIMARGYGAQAGMQAEGQLMELAKKSLMQQAQKYIAAGDYKGLAGFFADNNNYADGNSYAFHGVDPKTKNLVFSMNGQQQAIPAHLLPAYLEANLDPSKGIEFAKVMSQDERWRQMLEANEKAARIRAASGAGGSDGLGTPIGMSDDGTRLLFSNPKSKTGFAEIPMPAGYSKLFAKVTGREGAPAKPQFVANKETGGGFYIDPHTQEPLAQVSATGKKLPLGITEDALIRQVAEAQTKGVTADTMELPDGRVVLAYSPGGYDGRVFDTLQDAIAAQKDAKNMAKIGAKNLSSSRPNLMTVPDDQLKAIIARTKGLGGDSLFIRRDAEAAAKELERRYSRESD